MLFLLLFEFYDVTWGNRIHQLGFEGFLKNGKDIKLKVITEPKDVLIQQATKKIIKKTTEIKTGNADAILL